MVWKNEERVSMAKQPSKKQPGKEIAENEDVIIHPGMKTPHLEHPFMRKHGRSIMTGFLMKRQDNIQRLVHVETAKRVIGGALLLSLAFNFIQAHYPQQHALSVSLTSPDHDIIHTSTITVPLNTNSIVLNWAQSAICSSLTMKFSDYKSKMENARQYFTDGGYAGFKEAMEDTFLPDIINNRLIVTVAPSGPVVIRHNPNAYERWWDIEVPIVMTFSAGTKRSTTAVRKLALIKVVPVKPYISITGRAIDSVNLESFGDE